jgi:hypothetical protein
MIGHKPVPAWREIPLADDIKITSWETTIFGGFPYIVSHCFSKNPLQEWFIAYPDPAYHGKEFSSNVLFCIDASRYPRWRTILSHDEIDTFDVLLHAPGVRVFHTSSPGYRPEVPNTPYEMQPYLQLFRKQELDHERASLKVKFWTPSCSRLAPVTFLPPDPEHVYLRRFGGSSSTGVQSDSVRKPRRCRDRKDRLHFFMTEGSALGMVEDIPGIPIPGCSRNYTLFRFPYIDFLVTDKLGNAIFWFVRLDPEEDNWQVLMRGKIAAEEAGAGSIWHTPGWQEEVRHLLSVELGVLIRLSFSVCRFWPQPNLELFNLRHQK